MSSDLIADCLEEAFCRFSQEPAIIIDGYRMLNYNDLARLARRVESYLPMDDYAVVAIWCDRSFASFAALLACLLNGRPWVAVSPLFPNDRAAATLRSLVVSRMLISARTLDQRPGLLDALPTDTRVIALDEEGHGQSLRGGGKPRTATLNLPSSLFCVYGTSGSTGVPKYVPLTQGNVAAFLCALHSRFDLGPGRRLSLVHELSSSASLQNLLLGLSSGATLCVHGNGTILTLGQFLRSCRVDFVHLVPSAIRTLAKLGQLKPGLLPDILTTLIGGEIVRRPVVQAWVATAPRSSVFNSYGPTEVTVNIAITPCPASGGWVDDIAPVGTVFAGHGAALVEADGQPAAGENGELVISGPQVASGYLGRAEDTAAKFVRLPALDDGKAIWYRTGDLARSLPGSQGYTVTGRVDREFKIGGYRVDPGEIEAALRRAAPEASEAALVVVLNDEGIVERLVGFVENLRTEPARVLQGCRSVLPLYMVPNAVRGVSSLPLGVNGKIDYAALARLYREEK